MKTTLLLFFDDKQKTALIYYVQTQNNKFLKKYNYVQNLYDLQRSRSNTNASCI